MPGLFGFVGKDPRRKISANGAESLLKSMASVLCHHDEYRVDTHVDTAAGLAVGRIGFPHHNSTRWPDSNRNLSNAPLSFLFGTLYGKNPSPVSLSTDRPNQSEIAVALSGLEGSFTGLLHTRHPETTTIFVDRRASQPLFYVETNELLAFAPEVKALLALPGIKKDLNWTGIATFLVSGFLLSGDTLFSGIVRQPGGSFLTLRDGNVHSARYWRFHPNEDSTAKSESEFKEELGENIDRSVARGMQDSGKTMIFLSGGADSRAILGSALRYVNGDGSQLHTITWGSNPDKANADIAVARRIAARFSLNHQVVETGLQNSDYGAIFRRANYLLDGMAQNAAYHPDKLKIMESLYDQGFHHVLRGDELFGFGPAVYSNQEAMIFLEFQRFGNFALGRTVAAPDAYPLLCDASATAIDKIAAAGRGVMPNPFKECIFFEHRFQSRVNGSAYYKQIYLNHECPLLSENVIDVIERIPANLKINKSIIYKVISERYSMFNGISYADYPNFEDWRTLLALNTPVRKFVIEELEDTASGFWDIINKDALANLLAGIAPRRPASRLYQSVGKTLRKKLIHALDTNFPRFFSKIRMAKTKSDSICPDVFLMHSLILKNWYDTFFTGHTSDKDQGRKYAIFLEP
jgi:asparagine synthetase B (glutamine-hydrolysing)